MSLWLQNEFILVKPSLCRRIIYSLVTKNWQKIAQTLLPVKSMTPPTPKPTGTKADALVQLLLWHISPHKYLQSYNCCTQGFFLLLHAKKAMVYYPDPVILFLRDYKAVPHWFSFHYLFAFKIHLFSSTLAQFPVFQKNPAKIISQRIIWAWGGGRGLETQTRVGQNCKLGFFISFCACLHTITQSWNQAPNADMNARRNFRFFPATEKKRGWIGVLPIPILL